MSNTVKEKVDTYQVISLTDLLGRLGGFSEDFPQSRGKYSQYTEAEMKMIGDAMRRVYNNEGQSWPRGSLRELSQRLAAHLDRPPKSVWFYMWHWRKRGLINLPIKKGLGGRPRKDVSQLCLELDRRPQRTNSRAAE